MESFKKQMSYSSQPYFKDIPANLLTSLEMYYDYKLCPGSFLKAVLCNDLKGAIAHGDEDSVIALASIVKLLYNHIRADCWGSKENYEKWLTRPMGGKKQYDPTLRYCDPNIKEDE